MNKKPNKPDKEKAGEVPAGDKGGENFWRGEMETAHKKLIDELGKKLAGGVILTFGKKYSGEMVFRFAPTGAKLTSVEDKQAVALLVLDVVQDWLARG